MKTVYRKSTHPLIPGYHENGALQLVAATGTTFIMFHFAKVLMLMMGKKVSVVNEMMFPNIALPSLDALPQKWWTIVTHGWVHHDFFAWFTNMIWLYCFGAVLQNIASYKQLIPIFVTALLVGGGFYELSQLWYTQADVHIMTRQFMGAQAGVLALGITAITLAPAYRVHIAPGFTIPLALIVAIYVILDLVVYLPNQWNSMSLCLGGAIVGFIYALVMRSNYDPGAWIYSTLNKVQGIATPNEEKLNERKSEKRMELLRSMYEPKQGVSQQHIDAILDKITQSGYHTLSRDEKDALLRASKDNS